MRDDVDRAAAVIEDHVQSTPVVEVRAADLGIDVDAQIVLKLEYLQRSGSFKGRGATHFVATQDIGPAGLVAASGGNHGAAVAWAAQRFGHPCHIFVPTISAPAKVDRLRQFGAEVHQVGDVYADSLAASEEWRDRFGAVGVHAYNDPVVLAGAGTCAREFWMQSGGLDAILFATGGGGLAGGGAAWLGDRTEIVCCETEGTSAYAAAVEAGQPVDVQVSGAAADALGATSIGEQPWMSLSDVGASSAVVSDHQLLDAKALLWDRYRIVVEPSAAASMAALVSGAWRAEPGARVGVVLCGANTTIG
ncbi:MAG: serine/threonine dehydratase [Actinomycetota bacterium]